MRWLLVLCLSGWCARPALAAVESPDITLAYIPSITAVASYVARDTGLFEKNGLHVRLVAINQGSTAVAGIVSGSVQISTSLPTNFIQAFAGGLDIVVIANSHVYPTDNLVGILVRPASDIHGLADLRGRRVAVNGYQGIQHLLMLHALRAAGVDAARVLVLEVGFPQMQDALKSGQVDGATVSEPYYQRIIAAGTGRLLIDLQTGIPAGTMGTVYIATREWVEANPGTLAAFRLSLREAVAAIGERPALARESVMKTLHMDESVVADLHIPNLATPAAPAQMQFWVDLMREEQVLSEVPDVGRMIAP